MIRGRRELHSRLQGNLKIHFFFVSAVDTIPNFLEECGASLWVTDFSHMREVQHWKDEMCKRVNESVSVHEVDAHNIVPVWVASNKLEYDARILRGKINKKLPEYLIEFPELTSSKRKWASSSKDVDWENLITNALRRGAEVPELGWCDPGEEVALEVLMGKKNGFLTTRLKNYNSDRNNPLKPKGLSGLSPYLHFGKISAQRCALEACRVRKLCPEVVDAFLEELIVRRELADNFCFSQPHYDSLQGAWEWAHKTLMDHVPSTICFQLWNAARMYWAKKIVEWTSGPEEALAISTYLNDKTAGNGYVGCMCQYAEYMTRGGDQFS